MNLTTNITCLTVKKISFKTLHRTLSQSDKLRNFNCYFGNIIINDLCSIVIKKKSKRKPLMIMSLYLDIEKDE